jgi:hypothetical protein
VSGGGGKMARFGEQVGGVPESLGPTKRGGRGGSVAVVARRRDELGRAGQGGGHREICFPAEGQKRNDKSKQRGKFCGAARKIAHWTNELIHQKQWAEEGRVFSWVSCRARIHKRSLAALLVPEKNLDGILPRSNEKIEKLNFHLFAQQIKVFTK